MKKNLFKILLAGASFGIAVSVFGAALTDDRDTQARSGVLVSLTQGTNVIYAGALVAVDGQGLAQPAADTAGFTVVGRAERKSDNSTYVASTLVEVRRGTYKYATTNTVTDASIGAVVYCVDDQTVTTGGVVSQSNVVGRLVDTDSDGVWVDTTERN